MDKSYFNMADSGWNLDAISSLSGIQTAILLILSLFVVGAITIAVLSALSRKRTILISELWKLYFTEFLIVAAVLIPAFLGGFYFLLVLLFFNLRAHYEITCIHNLGRKHWVVISSFMASSLLLTAVAFAGAALFYVIIIQIVIIFIYLLILLVLIRSGLNLFIPSLSLLCLIILSLTGMMYIINMEDGMLMLLFLFIISETNDAFALVFGKTIGRRKIFTTITPNKTLEGMLFGVLFSTGMGVAYTYFVLGILTLSTIPLVILIVFGSIAGDLIFSAYKRRLGAKDFSEILRGQGGVLDIYDSLLVASLVFYYILIYLGGF